MYNVYRVITRSPIIRFVQTAAEQGSLEGIQAMLKVVTEELESWGTLIWLAGPDSDANAGRGRLFVLGYWVRDPSVRVWHALNFDSATGFVLKSKRPMTITAKDERIAKPAPSLIADSKSLHFCLAPMVMEGGSEAVLEVYRTEDKTFRS
jgi:hypothetical protein